MMPLLAELRTDARPGDERGAVRRTLRLEVQSSTVTDAASALIHNLSETGLLIETSVKLDVGEIIAVEMPEVGATAARVVRADGAFFGCEFVKRAPKAAVSAALLRAPVDQVGPGASLPLIPPNPQLGYEARREDFAYVEPSPAQRAAAIIGLIIVSLVVLLFVYALLALPISG